MTNLITPRALFSPILLPENLYELDRMKRFRDMAIQNYTRRLTAAILDLVQPEVETFDQPTRKPYHRTKREVNRITRCRNMAIRSVDFENPTLEPDRMINLTLKLTLYTIFQPPSWIWSDRK